MKYIKIFILFTFATLLTGCVFQNPKYIHLSSKPSSHYYADLIHKELKDGGSFTLKVFNRNLYKYYTVDEKDNDILLSFLESLNKESYKEEISVGDKSNYQLIIQFKHKKFIINAYNEQYITLYPWDGSYTEDKIDMTNVNDYNNIYKFCEYIINK